MFARMTMAVCALVLLHGPVLAQTPLDGQRIPHFDSMPSTPAVETPPIAPFEPGCGPQHCDADNRTWASVDFMLGWLGTSDLPDLVTTSPVGTAQANAGVLGLQSTRPVFNAPVNDDVRAGFRLQVGRQFGEGSGYGVQAGFSMLHGLDTTFTVTSNDNPILARPFTNALTNTPQSQLVAFPGVSMGVIEIELDSSGLYEGHINFFERIACTPWGQWSVLMGYRFFRYDEQMSIVQVISPTNPNFVAGTQIASLDEFDTENRFHGLDFGLRGGMQFSENLGLDVLAKVAVGKHFRQVDIRGSQVTSVPGAAPLAQVGGVYALTSNIGTHHNEDWAAMPELAATLKYQVTDHVQLRFSYSFLLLNRILRAPDQIDQTIDPALFPPAGAAATTPARPQVDLKERSVSVQNLGFGVLFTF